LIGAERLYVQKIDGSSAKGWPSKERNAFASSPAVGDLDGDGHLEVLCGADDDRLYAWRADGSRLPGWPVQTGGDVYSSPVLADLKGDGLPEVLFGSDDGCLYAVDQHGTILPGWPLHTGGFVSSTPVIGDVDADGELEVAVGSWDGQVYLCDSRGLLKPGWPRPTGDLVWSSPLLADVNADGFLEVIAASSDVHIWNARGESLPGWPLPLKTLAISSPLALDLSGHGELAIVIAADALYAWNSRGQPLEYTPAPLPHYVWSTPLAGDLDGDGAMELVFGCWDGGIYQAHVSHYVALQKIFAYRGAVFSSPAGFLHADELLMVTASWDKYISLHSLGPISPGLRLTSPMFRGCASHMSPPPHASSCPAAYPFAGPIPHHPPATGKVTAHRLGARRPHRPIWLDIYTEEGMLQKPRLFFQREGHVDWSPSPILYGGNHYHAILPPSPSRRRVRWYVEWGEVKGSHGRYPASGSFEYMTTWWRWS